MVSESRTTASYYTHTTAYGTAKAMKMPTFGPVMRSREAGDEFARCDFAHFNGCGGGGSIASRFVASPTLSPKA